jgi:DHA2 family multidrug resistance protein
MGIVVAPIIGPTLGGWITDNYSWRWIFYINIPVGLLAMLMANTFIEDPPYIRSQRPGRIDFVGFGLMAIGLATLQLVLDKGQEEDWFASAFIVRSVLIAVVALVAFVIWELRTKEPIVNLRVLANRNFATGTALIATVGVALYGTTALLPLFLQTLLGYPALQSGLAVSPRGIGAIVSMILVGRMLGKIDGRYLIVFGFGILAVSTYLLGDIDLEITVRSIAWPQVWSGFALGFVFVPLTVLSTGTLRNEEIGNATGIYNLMRNVGGSFGIAAVTTMLARGAQAHQAAMVSHLTPYDPVFRERLREMVANFTAHANVVTATQQAYAAMYQTLVRQATLLAYIDIFRILALICLICLPAGLLFKKVKSRGGPAAMH